MNYDLRFTRSVRSIRSVLTLLALAFSLQPSAFSATLPNDIRLQQFDGLQWNWIELRPINGSTLAFDASLQFKVDETQDLLTEISNITVSNVVSKGYLTLSGATNRLTVASGSLKLDGSAITGGGDTTFTNEAGGWTHLVTPTNRISLGFTSDPGSPTIFGVGAGLGTSHTNAEKAIYVENSSNRANAEKPVFFYQNNTYGLLASANGTNSTGANVGVLGTVGDKAKWNIGVVGTAYGANSTTNAGIYGAAATYGAAAVFNAIVGELVNDESAVPELIQQTTVLLLDNRDTAAPLIIARDNGVVKFNVATNGLVTAAGGFASTSTTAAVNIASGGWTNTFGVNAAVYIDGTGVTYTVYNNAGTSVYTNAATVTHSTVLLQPSGKVLITAGSGITGRATPF